ncbi:hypothetical protein ACYPKM_02675 [Pseudomonas aeruginosa]
MSTSVVSVKIPAQPGITNACEADFAANGMLLVAHMDPVEPLPERFTILLDGEEFTVIASEGDEYVVHPDLRSAFVSAVFG